MIYDAFYQLVDLREGEKSTPSLPVQLKAIPDGLSYYEQGSDTPKKLVWDDEDPDSFVDDEKNGVIIVVTPEGTILLQKIEDVKA